MTDNKITLTKEDIQAIAQELAKHTNNASACAKNSASGKKSTEGQNMANKKTHSDTQKAKSVAQWGIILVWVIVLVALAIKLTPYL